MILITPCYSTNDVEYLVTFYVYNNNNKTDISMVRLALFFNILVYGKKINIWCENK